jgi:hypothetical protein
METMRNAYNDERISCTDELAHKVIAAFPTSYLILEIVQGRLFKEWASL